MDDKPIVGTVGEPDDEGAEHGLVVPPEAPGPPAPPTEDGVVLYDPRPRERAPEDEPEPEPEPEPRPTWILPAVAGLLLVALAGGAYYSLRPTRINDGAELPPLVPSMIAAADVTEGLNPFDSVLRGAVGTPVTVSVRAVGPTGIALADTLVRFQIVEGDGQLDVSEARTGGDGIARATLTLPGQPGVTLVSADVAGASFGSATVRASAYAGTPESLTLLAGNSQDGGVGALLPERLAVQVNDAQGNPVEGVEVNFRVRSGSGITAPTLARTDASGQASALWRLGVNAGAQQLVASSPALTSSVTFTATARGRVRPTDNVDESAGIVLAPVTVRASTMAIGASHVCQIQGGAVQCRGSSDRGQSSTDGERSFVALASGISHVCALDGQGTAFCWGGNESGQLGNGLTNDQSTPVAVRTELKFSALTAGTAHTCGLAGGGIPACWGLNLSGQLGDGSRNDQRGPRTVGGGLAFQSLAAGWNHTCGVTASGNAFCWGLNSQGQLGDGSRLDRLVPTTVQGSMDYLVAGSSHTCGISDGEVLCWGGNAFGQVGDGTDQDRSTPTPVLDLPSAATALTAGAVHTCALVAGGAAYCWGQNLQGQIGDGSTENRARAVSVAGAVRFRELHAGGALTCGRALDGGQYCWGLNRNGQLGDGTRTNRLVPTLVGG